MKNLYQTQEPALSSGPVGVNVAVAERSTGDRVMVAVGLSLLAHLLLVGMTASTFLVLQFLGFDISLFDPLQLKPKDIEFVLVDNPKAPPRNKNTKNRSDRMSRSGGQKVANKIPVQSMKTAGTPKPQNKPKPRPKPTPKKVAQKPTPKPKKVTKPRPPSPRMPTPKVSKKPTPTIPPNPIAPTIKTPAPPNPKVIAAGPVIRTPVSSTTRTRSTPGPAQIPGGISGSILNKTTSGGSRAGSGGRSYTNQAGSPGGGGGRPGIDALPDPDYGAYMAELQRRIKRNWRPPSASEDKTVVVYFKISRDGRLLSASVQNSSGYQSADRAAVAAVQLSAPFRPLPAGHRDNALSVQFTFDYNVYKSKFGSR